MFRYEVTIRTDCRACALALAGHAPAVAKLRAVWVQEQRVDEDGAVLDSVGIHTNSPRVQHFGSSPLACPEHGGPTDTRAEPTLERR